MKNSFFKILALLLLILVVVCFAFACTPDSGNLNADKGGVVDTTEHTHSYIIKYDSNNHWEECECGDKKDFVAHAGGTATYSEKAVCATCNQSYGQLGSVHNFNEGVCSCGEVLSTYYTEGLTFEFDEETDTYIVASYTGTANKVIIPSIYQNKSVTSIGEWAFEDCTSLTSVEIPNSVTSIGVCAFSDCVLLQYTIEGNLKYLGNSENKYLHLIEPVIKEINTISINFNCKYIGTHAFAYCRSLTSIEIPNSVIGIGRYAFGWCSSLKSIEIPNSITNIEESAFYGCEFLEKVNYKGTIDQWVEINFDSAAANPTYYTGDLYINDNLVTDAVLTIATKISGCAFYNCNSLTSVKISDTVTYIGDWAFVRCYSLTNIEIPKDVTSIGYNIFSNCNSLSSIRFIDTSSWYVTKSSTDWKKKTGGTQIIVDAPSTNATYFKSTYNTYRWYKI